MKKTYSPVRIVTRHVKVPQKDEAIKLEIENRFDFTDLSECRIVWEMNGRNGETPLTLPPGRAGILRICPGGEIREGDRLIISVFSPQDILVDRTMITLGEKHTRQKLQATKEKGKLVLLTDPGYYTIEGDGYFWKISHNDGLILSAGTKGWKALIGGPDLMILPLKTGPCVTDYKLDIPPLNNLCHDRKADSIVAEHVGDTVKISMKVSWQEAHGRVEYIFLPGGSMIVRYDLTSDVNINPRQWGMVFGLSRDVQNLAWDRKGLWSIYPEDHIGRTHGKAVPFVTGSYHEPAFGAKPTGPWKDDANALGSNDFRSSKENIYWASLTNDHGQGIRVAGKGKTTVRAWVDGDRIALLVAGFSTGGGDLFFSSHYRDERRPLKRGDRFQGTATIRLTGK